MYGYISGEVKIVEPSYIIIDNGGIGYQIYVPNSYSFLVGDKYTVYTYTKVSEDEYTLYGFKTKNEKEFFLKLISVKGLGPKMALPMIAMGSLNLLEEAIASENISYLKKFPKIGDKVAKQMILDLKGKVNAICSPLLEKSNSLHNELIEALTSLGYKTVDIKKVVSKIDTSKTIEVQIKEALKLLLK